MKEEHVHRVEVIVGRLLEVTAVGVHLAFDLVTHDDRADLLPFGRSRNAGEKSAERVQRQDFPEQVGVWGEVERKIILEMAAVPVKLL